MAESRIEGAVQYAEHVGRKDRAETRGDDPYPLNRYLLTENALLAAGFTRAEIIAMTEAEYAYAHGSVQSGYAHGWNAPRSPRDNAAVVSAVRRGGAV